MIPDYLSSGIAVAIVGQALIGASIVWDKVLLRQPEMTSLINYVFWLGAISVFGVIVAVFGFHLPRLEICAIALFTGFLDLVATYFYYSAIKEGEASAAAAVMGGYAPLATILIGSLVLPNLLKAGQIAGFSVLVAAGFVMFFSEHRAMKLKRAVPRIVLASCLLGSANVLEKIVFNATGFVPGFVFITLGTFIGSMFMLLPPAWRAQIMTTSEKSSAHSRFWYFVNRFMNGVGAFLVFYAISLASPALVDALAGVRYGAVFVGVLALTRLAPSVLSENFSGGVLLGKSFATLMVGAGLVLLAYLV